MEKEIYTPMEKLLIDALIRREQVIEAMALDARLLELESEVGLMDGLPLEVEGQAL